MQLDNDPKLSANAGQCPVTAAGREFNPFVDPYLADPYAFWLRARHAEPVFYSPELDYWVVTRYEDIKAIFSDPKTFSASIAQNADQAARTGSGADAAGRAASEPSR